MLRTDSTTSGRTVTDEDVLGFLGPTRDVEAERWRVLGRSRDQALSESQILQAVSGQVGGAGSSIFPTARVSEHPVPALALDYVDPRAAWPSRTDRGEIGTLPLLMRVLRVSVWLAAGALMLLGMFSK